ncbi:MAG: hypothetical protein P4L51_00845 [Puia sp.]|nr:hypothetical protein [Puia sp.]
MKRFFYDWVPPRLDIWLMLLLSIILAFNSGIPSAISGYIIGSQSAIPADMSMANFAYSCGMACVLPLTMRIKQLTSSKSILCGALLIIILMNFTLSQTNEPLVMVLASFVIGCVRMVATLEVVLSLMPILMPKGERYQFYSVYYPISLIFGPLSGFLTAIISDHVNWKFSFHLQNLFLFAGLLITVLFVHPKRYGRKIPLYQYDWLGTIFLAASLLLISYLFSYGLTKDWFTSMKMQGAAIGVMISLVLFLQRSLRVKRPLADLKVLTYWKAVAGLIMIFLLCLLYNSTSLLSPFMNIVLKSNQLESAKVNTYIIPGFIAGSLLSYVYYRKFTNFNVMAGMACVCFLASNIFMYYLTSSLTSSADLFLPLFFRGMAIAVSYISVGLYVAGSVPVSYFIDLSTLLIILRSVISPVLASALYANLIYRGQIKYVNYLAGKMDGLNSYVTARGAGVVSSVKVQASMLAVRDVYGILIIAGIVLLAVIIVFPFHGSNKRTVLDWKSPFYKNDLAQAIPG